jgi:hypothetical protein
MMSTVLAVIAVGGLLVYYLTRVESEHARQMRDAVITAAAEAVATQLSAPETARFGNRSEVSVQSLGDGLFEVRGTVESLTAEGHSLAGHYYCRLKDVGNGTWKAEEISIVPQ